MDTRDLMCVSRLYALPMTFIRISARFDYPGTVEVIAQSAHFRKINLH